LNSMRCSNRPGFVEAVLKETIPMHGRMIHGRGKNGELWEESQPYDVGGRVYNGQLSRMITDIRLLTPEPSL
jgi:kynurenine 3-monooxygenase